MAPTGGAGATATAGTTGTAGRGGTTGSAGSSGTAGTTGSAGTSGGAGTATQLTVKLKGDPTATQWMWADLQITNIGASAIPMSDLTVRYWYTFDTTPIVTQADQCGYANTPPGQCTNITRSWFAVSPARTNADYYLQIGFAAAAGNLNPGATAEFDLGWHKNDWTNFTQANDYSYNGATAFTTTSKVTVYRQGVLVYGMEPSP